MHKRPSWITTQQFALVCLMFYFAFHAFHGERGVFALLQNQHQLNEVERELAATKAERLTLEKRVKGLRTHSLDLDLLDEQARNMLGLAKDNEMLLVWPKRQSSAQ